MARVEVKVPMEYFIDRLKNLMVNTLGQTQPTVWCNKLVETLSDSLAQLEVEPLGDTLALVLAKAGVNKQADSLAVVKVKKRGYTESKVRAENQVETVQDRQKKKSRHLVTHSQRWRLRYWWTHTVKK